MTSRTPFRDQKNAVRRWFLSTSARMALAAAAILLGVASVEKMSVVSTAGYDITELERDIRGLEAENQRLDVAIAYYRSMASIQERLATLSLVSAEDVIYLPNPGHVVARK